MSRNARRHASAESGFTLMELVVAVFIVSVMAAVVMPHIVGIGKQVKATACEQNQRMIRAALSEYYLMYHAYPLGDTSTQLAELKDAHLLESIPTEPDGGHYVITISNDEPEVTCDVHGPLGAP